MKTTSFVIAAVTWPNLIFFQRSFPAEQKPVYLAKQVFEKAMNLRLDQKIIFAQSAGYPKK